MDLSVAAAFVAAAKRLKRGEACLRMQVRPKGRSIGESKSSRILLVWSHSDGASSREASQPIVVSDNDTRHDVRGSVNVVQERTIICIIFLMPRKWLVICWRECLDEVMAA